MKGSIANSTPTVDTAISSSPHCMYHDLLMGLVVLFFFWLLVLFWGGSKIKFKMAWLFRLILGIGDLPDYIMHNLLRLLLVSVSHQYHKKCIGIHNW